MLFSDFSVQCRERGLQPKHRTDTHWQIYSGGRLLVDVWPTTNKYRQCGLGQYQTRHGYPQQAMEFARTLTPRDLEVTEHRGTRGRTVTEGIQGLPWCDACQSYHHPDNPSCKARTGAGFYSVAELDAMQSPVREKIKERIPLGEPVRNVKVFRGSHGKGGESAQLRRACDYLNKVAGGRVSGNFLLTPDRLEYALNLEPSAAEYKDALRGLMDVINTSTVHPIEKAELVTAIDRAEELLAAGSKWDSKWEGGKPPAAGDSIIFEETATVVHSGEVQTVPITGGPTGCHVVVKPARSGKPRPAETEQEYRKRTRARITALAEALRELMKRVGAPDDDPHWGADFVRVWDDCKAALSGLAEPVAAGPVQARGPDDDAGEFHGE